MSTAPTNPLYELHEQAEAEFQPYADVQIVSTFGEPQAEYAAIRKGAALMDLPQRGFLELRGKDRLEFLNRLITNETFNKSAKTCLSAGQGVYAFFLNTKGRIVTDMNVLELGDRTLLELDYRLVETMRAALEKYLFTEQATIANRTGEVHEIALYGPKAGELLSEVLASPLPDLKPLGSVQGTLLGTDVILWRDDPTGAPGYHLIIPTDAAPRLWMELVTRFAPPGIDDAHQPRTRRLRAVGWAAFNTGRIEAGRAMFGIDFDDSVLPAETGQISRAISFTKGCYLGQEIVARMHARGQVARQLVGIRMPDDNLPMAGAPVMDDAGNQIGGVTSSTISPLLSGAAIALGYVKKPFIPPGSVVTIPAEGAMRKGTVSELPFIKEPASR